MGGGYLRLIPTAKLPKATDAHMLGHSLSFLTSQVVSDPGRLVPQAHGSVSTNRCFIQIAYVRLKHFK